MSLKAYIRKLNQLSDIYYIVLGTPDNHTNNTVLDEEFYTRRMAERFIKRHGYELIKRKPRATATMDTNSGMKMRIGDYLHFRAWADWDLYYRILGLNNKSMRITAPVSECPAGAKIIHRISRTSNFSSGTPTLTINGDRYLVRIQKRKEAM